MTNRLANTKVTVLIDIPDPTGIGWFASRGEKIKLIVRMQETSFCENKHGLTAVVPNYHLAIK